MYQNGVNFWQMLSNKSEVQNLQKQLLMQPNYLLMIIEPLLKKQDSLTIFQNIPFR